MGKKGKLTRNKNKKAGKTNPISLFVRNKISAQKYWEMTGLSGKYKGESRELLK